MDLKCYHRKEYFTVETIKIKLGGINFHLPYRQTEGGVRVHATFRGLATYGMQGFDYEKARKDLEIPDNFDVLAMIAIGRFLGSRRPTPQRSSRHAYHERLVCLPDWLYELSLPSCYL